MNIALLKIWTSLEFLEFLDRKAGCLSSPGYKSAASQDPEDQLKTSI